MWKGRAGSRGWHQQLWLSRLWPTANGSLMWIWHSSRLHWPKILILPPPLTACSLPRSLLTSGIPASFPPCNLDFPLFFLPAFSILCLLSSSSLTWSLSFFHPSRYLYLTSPAPFLQHFISHGSRWMAACTAALHIINLTSLSDKQMHAYKTL